MQHAASPSVLSVGDPDRTNILTNPRQLSMMAPFIGRSCTVTQAAAEVGQKPNTMLKAVQRLCEVGLLSVVDTRKRRGRTMRVYRSVADAFFIPFEATSAETLEAAMARHDLFWEEALRRNVVRSRLVSVESWGTRIYRDADGSLQVQMAVDPEKDYLAADEAFVGSEALSTWRDNLYLDFRDAKMLQREMLALISRYVGKRGRHRYLLRLGLAAFPDLEHA